MVLDRQTLEVELLLMQDNMYNFAYQLTTNADDAKDLMQETILKALANIDKYYKNVNLKGWVFTIMHNIFVNNYRRALHNYTITDHTECLYYLNLSQDLDENDSEMKYTVTDIYNVIESFQEAHKKPFKMHLSGYKYEEIANEMNLPLGTVKSRIFFMRKRLQELLKDYR